MDRAALVKTGRMITAAGALTMLAALVGCVVSGPQAAPTVAFWAGGAIQVAGLAIQRRGTFGRWV